MGRLIHPYRQIRSADGANPVALYPLLIPFLVIALVLWLLNPYICCPQDTTSMMMVTVSTTEDYQKSMNESDMSLGQGQASQSQTTVQNPLARGTPKSLPDSTPYLLPPTLIKDYQDYLAIELTPTNEKPQSAIVLPIEYPPAV